MQHDTTSPSHYLASLPDDWRGDLVRQLHESLTARGLRPGIGYKMLAYEDATGVALHLNAQVRHVGLYPGRLDVLDPDGALLEGFDRGASCLRLKKRDALALDRIEAVIDRVLALRADGIIPDC